MNKLFSTITAVIIMLIPLKQLSAQDTISIERIFQSPTLDGSSVRDIKVAPDGKRVTFLRGKETDYEKFDLWEYHIATGKTQMLFNSDDLHSGDEQLSEEEKARRERMRLSGSGIVQYEWSNDGKALLFPLAGDVYFYKIGEQKAKRLLDTPEFETDLKFSPLGNFISYIRNQNLFIMNIETREEKAITSEGGGNIKFGMAEFVAQEEMARMTGYWWSPDETYIAYTKVDESPVESITRSEIYADKVTTIEQKYPKAGTHNVLIELAVVQLKDMQRSWINLGENKDIYLARAKWMNNNTLTYQIQSRDQKRLDLNSFDVANQKIATLLTETSDTWVNLHDDLVFLKNQNQFIWASERDGYKHLYLYNNNGKMLRQLTQGDWVVDDIKGRQDTRLFIQARKDTPLESHLYSLDLATNDIQRLTEKNWYNDVNFSKDGSIFVNNRSNLTHPPQISLHDNSGKRLTWLNQNKVDESHPLHVYMNKWIKPTLGSFKTEDDTKLYYRLYTPHSAQHNPNKKHPAIVYLYGGPHAQVVTNKWGHSRELLMQHWASKGYVVFSIDNRGSNYRGKDFEDPIYQAMGDIEVKDQVSGVEFLRTFSYVDASRVGVYGHSYGGYMTLMAMFKAPNHFAAGVSGAPVTDWRLYDTHYTERYMGDPREVDDAYTASSVFPYAKNLKGKLLIYHGMADDNVLFTHSTMLYKHLQDLAIPFEVMDYPGKKHSIRGKNTGIHLYHTITNFFDRHLAPTQAHE